MNIAILDASLGDTGKGRVVNYFSSLEKYQWCSRIGAANNCGHLVYRNNKKYNYHFLPSVDYTKNIKSFLGSGMYIHLQALLEEIKSMEVIFPGMAKSIYIDQDAFVITDEHIKIDREQNKHLGTTGKGVGVAASEKYARRGTHIYDYINDNAEVIQEFKKLGVHFTTILALREEFEKSNIIFEGHQGALLGIDTGIFPYVTSSDCSVACIYASGFNFIKLDKVYGLAKGGYVTKSGEGPLPTEIIGVEADRLRKLGNEIGNSTGRNRRIAYMDLPTLKYGIRKGGITHLILTKLDIMNCQETIRACYDYGKELFSPNDFKNLTPHYTELPGWRDARDINQVRPFIKHIEDFTGTKVEYISVGVSDEDMIYIANVADLTPPPLQRIGERDRFSDPFETPSFPAPAAAIEPATAQAQAGDFDQACIQAGLPKFSDIAAEIYKKIVNK